MDREFLYSREVAVAPDLLFACDYILDMSDLAGFVSLYLLLQNLQIRRTNGSDIARV